MLKKFLKTKYLIVTAVLVVAVFVLVGCGKEDKKGDQAAVTALKKLPKEVTEGIWGSYNFIKDSEGSGLNEEAVITITFSADGSVFLSAVQPGETLNASGVYEIENEKMTISLPEIGKEAKEADYSLSSGKLELPFLAINDGEGISHWEKIEYTENPTRQGELYLEYLFSQNTLHEEAMGKAMAFLEKQEGVTKTELSRDKKNIVIEFDSGPNVVIFTKMYTPSNELDGPKEEESEDNEDSEESEGDETGYEIETDKFNYAHCIVETRQCLVSTIGQVFNYKDTFAKIRLTYNNSLSKLFPKALAFPTFPPTFPGTWGYPTVSSPSAIASSKHQVWLNNEPEPLKLGDAPEHKKALVIDPMYSEFTYSSTRVNDQGVPENYKEHIGNPDVVAGYLQNAEYDVTGPFTDENYIFSLKEYIDFFTQKEPYGVVYWASHGGEAPINGKSTSLVFLGIKIGKEGDSHKTLGKKYDQYLKEQFEGVPEQYQDANKYLLLAASRDILATPEFVETLVQGKLSRSLIYMDVCDSVDPNNSNFKEAFHAKAFVGWSDAVSSYLASSLAEGFFANISKKTRTAREAHDFALDYSSWRVQNVLKDPTGNNFILSRTMGAGLSYYRLYIMGESKPEERLTDSIRGMLIQTRAYVARQSDQDLKGSAETLRKCYNDYWSKKDGAGLKHQFCHDARVGWPTQEDTANAIGILTGYDDGRKRFTLIE